MGAADNVILRRAARVILLDDDDSVLLFRGLDSTRPQAGSWWFTPGGGVEPGESMRDAALRELREETGLALDDPATRSALLGPVHHHQVDIVFEGVQMRQSEAFFTARVSRFTIESRWRTELEKRTMLESRWWSILEIETTTDTIYPVDLADLARRCVAAAAPER